MTRHERFPIRGVIEGFYGKPWTHEERLDMIQFLGRHQFNAYFYAPKDDPYLRERWQEKHPEERLRQLDELIHACQSASLAFYYCLSPGLNMEYSNRDHTETLLGKYRNMYERGVRHFALQFDDIPQNLLHAADVEQYGTLADAHADTTLRIWDEITGWTEEVELVICPTQYHGLGNEPYISRLGQRLPQDVHLFWTGRFVCSPFLTEGDAIRFQEYTGHQPLFWDNYPVNDLAMANELHIGPLRNRDPELGQLAAGYVANAMERVESSKIPLITIADYLRDPAGYDPIRSWRRAVEEVAGPEDAQALLRFADNVQSSFLHETESPALLESFMQFRFQFQHGNKELAIRKLGLMFSEMEETAHHLLSRMKNQKLSQEISKWVEKYRHWAKVGQTATALIDAGTNGRIPQAAYHMLRLRQWVKRTERLPQKVCGQVMSLFVEALLLEVRKST
ncbi:protein O-GlcNAcase [Brevibacillus ruminantium]|uniref:Protein O-GlcNAcase n=1 Tax=Brevibacillus ruminantium TaxID=2950604 RepID=A0ABY4WAH6_9BACL|nr:protein O-GlcNAcase [Brevibacillus ruminantium]USG64168.1 protein O-GlcNAcase [Brevibacillus ruminantium]